MTSSFKALVFVGSLAFAGVANAAFPPEQIEFFEKSIRPLLANPQMPWDQPAVTTYKQNNHTVRSEGWRYTHYSDGGEELYNETKDPYEWTNLAKQPGDAAPVKKDLGKYLPTDNKPPAPGGGPGEGGEGGGKAKRRKQAKQ